MTGIANNIYIKTDPIPWNIINPNYSIEEKDLIELENYMSQYPDNKNIDDILKKIRNSKSSWTYSAWISNS